MKEQKFLKIIFFIVFSTPILFLNFLCSQNIDKGRNKQMGYCFDADVHPEQSRLYVAAGIKGMHVFDARNGHLRFVTTVYDTGYYRNIQVFENHAFVADAFRGLTVLDIASEEPQVRWYWKEVFEDIPGGGVYIDGKLLYLSVMSDGGNDTPGLYIFDVNNPERPEMIGYCRTRNAWDVWVQNGYAYVADYDSGLCVIDVSEPHEPCIVNRVLWQGARHTCAEIVRGDGAYLTVAAGWAAGAVLFDIQDSADPELLDTFISGPRGCGEGLVIRNRKIYLTIGNELFTEQNGMYTLDISENGKMQVQGRVRIGGWPEGICLCGSYAFVANTYYGIRSLDITDPELPRLVDHFGPEFRTPIDARLWPVIKNQGVDSALALFHTLHEDSSKKYSFEESRLNWLGYRLLQNQQTDAALTFFKLNKQLYPESYNVYDSLGEAYLAKGDTAMAISNYKKSLELNPENKNARKVLKK